MKTTNVVILGGGYAGVNAALRLRCRDKDVKITLVNERDHFVERIRNHQRAAGQPLKNLPMTEVLGQSIEFVAARAERIDPVGKQVTIKGEHDPSALAYDVLVYALGSGAQKENTTGDFSVNTATAAEALRAELENHPQKSVTIRGAGLTGLELATELREAWPDRNICLTDRHALGSTMSPKAQKYLNETLAAMRIDFRLAETNSDRADSITVDCTGFTFPAVGRLSGLQTDEKNRVLTNEFLQAVGHPHIFVCGDAAAYGFGIDAIAYSGCATAQPMGTHVGEAIFALLCEKTLPPFRFGFMGRCISLGRKKGIVQFLDKASGQAVDRALTGKAAATLKELICRMTMTLPRWERKTRWPLYTWPKRIRRMLSEAAA